MLFLLTTPDVAALPLVNTLAGDEERELLLISDGVYLALNSMIEKLFPCGFDTIYAEKKAVEDRGVEVAPGCSVASMEDIVDIVLDNGKVINL